MPTTLFLFSAGNDPIVSTRSKAKLDLSLCLFKMMNVAQHTTNT